MTAASRASRRATVALVLAAGLGFGCDSGDDEDDADTVVVESGSGGNVEVDVGEIEMSFAVGGAVAGSLNLVDPLVGTVYGGIYRSADVGATGPREGAEQFAYVEATGVDLTAGTSAVLWTSEPLPADTYTFLGFFDVDGSSADLETKDPESGDPVTLPSANTVEVEPGVTSTLEVSFDLVLG